LSVVWSRAPKLPTITGRTLARQSSPPLQGRTLAREPFASRWAGARARSIATTGRPVCAKRLNPKTGP
jgi:hypothetical protein